MTGKSRSKITFQIGSKRRVALYSSAFCADHSNMVKSHSVLYPTNNLGFSRNSHEPLARPRERRRSVSHSRSSLRLAGIKR
jgi:hypothetical protein